MQGIGRACVVNPINSIATVLLATPRQSIEIEELITQIDLHHRLITLRPCLASIRIEGSLTGRRSSTSPVRKSFTSAATNSATSLS